jgi:hypothetical protein
METLTFGLIAEGPTDHQVLISLLIGLFENEDRRVNTRPFQPLTDATAQGTADSFGGWENVLAYVASPKFEEAFPFVDFVVVQIDTDVCEETRFGVATHEGGQALPVPELVGRVADHLRARIGAEAWERVGGRTIFAVAVDSVECWLLVVHAPANQRDRRQNCLEHLNRALAKSKERPINAAAKSPRQYEKLARPFEKPKDLMRVRKHNASLDLFLAAAEQTVAAAPPRAAGDAACPEPNTPPTA